jgi:hypothetical protein
MIDVTIRLVDFMEVTPVANAYVAVTVKVVPRWQRVYSSDSNLYSDLMRFDPISNQLFDQYNRHNMVFMDAGRAWDITQEGTSAADGTFGASFDVAEAFQVQSQITNQEGEPPTDVVAVLEVSLRIPWLGFNRTIPFFVASTRKSAASIFWGQTPTSSMQLPSVLRKLLSAIPHRSPPPSGLTYTPRSRMVTAVCVRFGAQIRSLLCRARSCSLGSVPIRPCWTSGA